MEVQETVPGEVRITPEYIALKNIRERLHPNIREAFRSEMVRNLDTRDRNLFSTKANRSFDRGFVQSMKGLICVSKAQEFLLWFVHQSIDTDLKCGYCIFLDGIYDMLSQYLDHPHIYHDKVVKTT